MPSHKDSDHSSDEPLEAPNEVKTTSFHPNGKLLSDQEIETFSQRKPKQGDYFHRKKAGLMTSDRIDSDYPIAVGKEGALYAVYRDAKLDDPVLLGKGSFGKVRLVQDLRYTSTHWIATKIITAEDEKSEDKCRQAVLNEMNILQAMGQTPTDVIIERRSRKNGLLKFQFFMDLAKGVNLNTLVKEQTLPTDPHSLLKIGESFLEEVERLHNLGYLHRDIKTGNIFINTKTGKATLIDFGLGIKMNKRGQVIDQYCGTTTTMAPEIFDKYKKIKKKASTSSKATDIDKHKTEEACTYSKATDIYAAGIVLFALLFGKDRTCSEELYNDVLYFKMGWKDHKKCIVSNDRKNIEVKDDNNNIQYTFRREIWDILNQMIDSRPNKRPHATKVLKIFKEHLAMLEGTTPTCRCM